MGAAGLLAAFTLLICLGGGLMFVQGIQAVRYRAERCNRAAAAISCAAAVAALVCFTARLGHVERVFGMFASVTSPTTHLLYAEVLFVVACAVYLVAAMRSEDGSVARWCGVAAIAASVLVLALVAFGNYNYLHLSTLTPDFWALAAYFALNALALGALAELVLGAALGCDDACGLARRVALACVALSAVGAAVVLGVFSLDSQAEAAATTSMFSMTKYNVKAAGSVAATDTLAVLFAGAGAPLFWGGVVAVGTAAPLGLSAALFFGKGEKAGGRALARGAIALVCTLVGAVCFRLCLVLLGI